MNYKNVCLGLYILVIASAIHAAPLVKVEITDAISKKAVCNDGSPGVYYLRNGFGSGAKRWVIRLEGGFPCDTPDCPLTSVNAPSTVTFDGLFSDNPTLNPDFYNANTVYVLNCSGDLWSGNKLQTAGSRPTQFRGRIIFRSVIAELIAKSGNNLLSPGTEILLAGGSSGGIGVMVHLDWLARKLPQAKVRGLNDGGWLPEKSTGVLSFEEGIIRGMPLWKGKPDVDCERANRTQKSKCYLSRAYPYITTPLFIAESQWDWIFVPDVAATQGPIGAEFAKAVRDSLVPVQAAWSPRVLTHVMSDRFGFSTQKIGTVTFKDLLGNWFFDRAGKVKAVKK